MKGVYNLDEYDCRMAILDDLRGTTGLQFQLKIREVLRLYYKSFDKKYEMPSPYGGDDKNDGWVPQDAIFYQIYAPTQVKSSLSKEIRKKFENDLIGLVEKISEGSWGGNLNKFIFIVNTFDTPLPKDPDRFFDSVVKKIKKENGIEFDYRVDNLDYIQDILMEISDINVLMEIASTLKVKNIVLVESITEKLLMDTIESIASNINKKLFCSLNYSDYKKISTIQKIYINDLGNKKEEIESLINHLDIVESTVEIINQDIKSSTAFTRVVNLIISKYKELSKKYNGVELLENLVAEIQKYSPRNGFTEYPTRLLICYVFDRCDIFKKEEDELNDITQ